LINAMQRETMLVDVVDAIGREKQQPVKIFEHAQEHADERRSWRCYRRGA